ncbi:MAG: hypothetical protein ACR2LI_02365 [Propionibacteriaceae bacterium]
MDVDQPSTWIVVVGVWVLLPFLLVGPRRPRHAIAVRLAQLGAWALPHLQAKDPDVDPLEIAAHAAAVQRDRLTADLRRLRHLVRTDEAMSATRQMGNRIAYDQLRQQLAALEPAGPLAEPFRAKAPASRPTTMTREILDLDWRH